MSKRELEGIVTKRKYKIRPKTFGDDNVLMDNIGEPALKTDVVRMKVGALRRYTVHLQTRILDKESKEWRRLTLEQVDLLPSEEGVQLYNAIQKLNLEKTSQSFLEQSPSQSSESTESPSQTSILKELPKHSERRKRRHQ